MKSMHFILKVMALVTLFICLLCCSAFTEEVEEPLSFPEGVIVIPQGAKIEILDDDQTVVITDCPREIFENDTFIVYLQDLPLGYVAKDVHVENNRTVILTEKADESVYRLLNEEGNVELSADMYEFIPAYGSVAENTSVSITDYFKYKDGKFTVTIRLLEDATMDISLSNMHINHSFSNGEMSLSLSGNWDFSSSLTSKGNSIGEVNLGELRIYGIGKIALSINVSHSISMKYSFSGTFKAGFQTGSQGGIIHEFSGGAPTLEGKGQISVSLKISAGIDILVAEADIYAQIGVTTQLTNKYTRHDDVAPPRIVECNDYKFYIFANIGAEAKYTSATGKKKTISAAEMELMGEKDSPVIINVHFENGHLVGSCSEGMETVDWDYLGGIAREFGSTVLSEDRERRLDTDVYLPWDVVVEGDYRIDDGGLNLNGHTLTIQGDLIHSGGTLTIGSGKLIVEGNYRLQSEQESEYGDSTGKLNMTHGEDQVDIAGNFFVQTTSSAGTLTAGTINLIGNFYQKISSTGAANFNSGSGLNLVMTSDRKHSIHFEDPDNNSIGWLTIDNEVLIQTSACIGIMDNNGHDMIVNGTLTSTKKVDLYDYDLMAIIQEMDSIVLTRAMSVQSVPLFHDLDLSGYTLTVNGDMISAGEVDLNGGILKVTGNLYHRSGTIFVDQGKMEVSGNYYSVGADSVFEEGKINFTNGSGYLKMIYASDEVHIRGDYLVKVHNGYNNLAAGTLYIGGNFTQLNGSGYGFIGGTEHRTVLNGTGRQKISFESGNSGFGILQTTNEDLVFANNVNWLTLGSDIHAVSDGLVLASREINLSGKTVTIDGDLLLISTIDINGGEMNVNGSVRHSSGELKINLGKLNISGNYHQIGADSTFEPQKENIIDGSGYLKMDYASDEVHIGGDYLVKVYNSYNSLVAGTLYIGGDLTQLNGFGYGFIGGTEHRTVLNGTGRQRISFESGNSGFGILQTTNEDLVFANNVNWLTLGSDIHAVSDGLVLASREINLSGKTVTIDGDLLLISTIDINGGEMNVNGSVRHSSGELKINLGKLNISGNYHQIGADSIFEPQKENIIDGRGYLKMDYASDEVHIGGDYLVKVYNSYNSLVAGTLYIGGNLTQLNGSGYGFIGGTEHKTVLNGTGRQRISFESGSSGFGILQSTNEDLVFANNANWLTLGSDIHAVSDGLVLASREINLSGKTVTVDGDLLLLSTIDINGGEMNVNGSVRHSSGNLKINLGKLNINGNYHQIGADSIFEPQKENIIDGSGYLKMDYVSDEVHIGGDYLVKIYNGYNNLAAGTLYIGGNFTQLNGNGSGFVGGTEHRTVLSGTGSQRISFESSISGFGILQTTNENLVFANNVNWLTLGSDIHAVSDGLVLASREINLSGKTVTIDGDLLLISTLDINGGEMNVNGSVRHSSGELKINLGKLNISGNYHQIGADSTFELQKENIIDGSGYLKMDYASDEVHIGGDYLVKIYNGYNNLAAGTLYIGGDFTQLNGNGSGFVGGTEHRTVLNGIGNQRISFESSISGFGILQTTNENLVFANNVNWLTLGSDIHAVSDGLVLASREINLSGKTVTIDGDLLLISTLDINGGEMNVNGSVRHSSGELKINLGKLNISGNYHQIGADSTFESQKENIIDGSGYLKMDYASDEVHIGGNYLVKIYNGYNNLAAGTLYIGGNLTQLNGSGSSFVGGTEHRTVLNGTESQRISFESGSSGFGILQSTNEDLVFANNVNWLTLESDIHAVSDEAILASREINLSGKTLTIDGDLTVKSNIDINKGCFVIYGNLLHPSGTITINRGILCIQGNYYLSGYDDNAESEMSGIITGTGKLVMNNSTDEVIIAEHFFINVSVSSVVEAGELRVSGDIAQLSGTAFIANEAHKVILEGNRKQTISFSNSSSRFGTLEITRSLRNYQFNPDPCWLILIQPELQVFGDPDFMLPASITVISDSAFEGIVASVVYIPDTCISIGADAFKDSSVMQIRIPSECSIDETAFNGCIEVFIFSESGSEVEDYCDRHDNCFFVEEQNES